MIQRISLLQAKKVARNLEKFLKPVVSQQEVVGSIARHHPQVKDIDLVVVPKRGINIRDYLFHKKFQIIGRDKAFTFIFQDIPVNVWVTDRESFGATVLHFGAGRGIIHIKRLAIAKGMTLNRYGLFKDGEKIAGKNYRDILSTLETTTKFQKIKWIEDAVKDVHLSLRRKFLRQGDFPHKTSNYYRFRQKDPEDFDPSTFRLRKKSDGNAIVIGKLKETGKWITQSKLISVHNITDKELNNYLKDLGII